MTDVPLHVAALQHLQSKTEERRFELLEQMGGGLSDLDYRITVGRVRECKLLLENISDLIKTLMRGEFEDDDESERPEQTIRHQPRKSRSG